MTRNMENTLYSQFNGKRRRCQVDENEMLWRYEYLDRQRREYFDWEEIPPELLEELFALRRELDELGFCVV